MSFRGYLPATLAVAATYVYFLLFAQFAFLEVLRERLGAAREVETAMAAMGLAGLAASLGVARLLRRLAARRLLAAGFVACAASALASLAAVGRPALVAAAAAIGASTAVVTVALAANLRRLVPGRRFGLAVGTGTGLAYLFCNLPPVFEGSPERQGVLAAGACLGGLAAALAARESPRETVPERPALARPDFRGWGFASVVVSFLALIWLDSAAFAVIQESAVLKGLTWGDAGQKLVQGRVHFAAAVAAGWLVDRGFFRSLLLAACGLFATSFLLLGEPGRFAVVAGPLYAVGISLYSVALVAYPSYRADEPGLVPRRWRAAVVFGVAGWIGSALGVGMAQSLHRIPIPFVAGVGAVLSLAWALARRGRTATLLSAHALTLAAVVAAVVVYALRPAAAPRAGEPAVERGRRVYVAEGCIHCHSQYVRPRAADVELWGPHRDAAGEEPPLYGNRRQGPDLSNAGSRRSAAWHRLHLLDPRAVVPTSRMPSYAHLFAAGSTRGDDLVAYLASLGAGAADEWYEITRRVEVSGAARGGSAARGKELFGTYCAPCHGVEGRGDGPLAPALYRPAMNLRKGELWLVSWGEGAEPLDEGLARLVKYGVPGTSMPGHEYLTDRQIADLVAFVRRLSGEPRLASAIP